VVVVVVLHTPTDDGKVVEGSKCKGKGEEGQSSHNVVNWLPKVLVVVVRHSARCCRQGGGR
jgi:hypothetical protein